MWDWFWALKMFEQNNYPPREVDPQATLAGFNLGPQFCIHGQDVRPPNYHTLKCHNLKSKNYNVSNKMFLTKRKSDSRVLSQLWGHWLFNRGHISHPVV